MDSFLLSRPRQIQTCTLKFDFVNLNKHKRCASKVNNKIDDWSQKEPSKGKFSVSPRDADCLLLTLPGGTPVDDINLVNAMVLLDNKGRHGAIEPNDALRVPSIQAVQVDGAIPSFACIKEE